MAERFVKPHTTRSLLRHRRRGSYASLAITFFSVSHVLGESEPSGKHIDDRLRMCCVSPRRPCSPNVGVMYLRWVVAGLLVTATSGQFCSGKSVSKLVISVVSRQRSLMSAVNAASLQPDAFGDVDGLQLGIPLLLRNCDIDHSPCSFRT